ncbi:MAG: hypothetical protein RLY16_1040 [Bacteroidota bacterium]
MTIFISQLSCKKGLQDELVAPQPVEIVDTSFKQILVPSGFEWKTDQMVTLQVTPLTTPIKIVNTLRIADESGQNVFFAERVSMQDAVTRTIRIPDVVTQVIVKFGSIQKLVPVSQGIISFNYSQD